MPSGRLDVAGILLIASGLSLVLIGFSLKGNTAGGHAPAWADPGVAGCLIGGLVLLALLVPVERRATIPVLPIALFGNRTYSALLVAGFFFQAAAMPVGVLLPLYFQYVRDYSATVSGLLLLPLMIGMAVSNHLTAAIILRSRRAKPVLLVGAGLLTVGAAAFFIQDTETPMALIVLWLLIAGLGSGPPMGGITIATQNAVQLADMGTATAGSTLTKQLGGAFGLACAQSLLSLYGTGGPTAQAIGSSVAWGGAIGGALALAGLLLMRNIAISAPGGRVPAPTPRDGEQTTQAPDRASA
ncbi:MFS transporter [Nocardiopsis rhodophaea]